MNENANVERDAETGSTQRVTFVDGLRSGDREQDTATNPIHRLNGSKCIVSTVRLSHPDLPLSETIEETPDVRIEPNYQTNHGGTRLLVFSVETDTLDLFERTLRQDHTVADAMAVEYGDSSVVYRTRLTDEVFSVTPMLAQLGVQVQGIVGTGSGWTLQALFPTRGTFSTFRRFCTNAGVNFRVNNLTWGHDDVLCGDANLTSDQWDTLHTAYERGYYDVPRRISQRELADELGISSSAVSQRLRRITGKLIEEQVRSTEE